MACACSRHSIVSRPTLDSASRRRRITVIPRVETAVAFSFHRSIEVSDFRLDIQIPREILSCHRFSRRFGDALFCVLLCSARHGHCRLVLEQGRGTILGTVTDSSGAAMPNVRWSSPTRGRIWTHPTTTGGEGYYTLPNLPVGEYRIAAPPRNETGHANGRDALEVDQKAQVDIQALSAARFPNRSKW